MSILARVCGESLARYCNNPNSKEKDEVLDKLLGLINGESEGPQKATKILIQYLQSPRENEALSAINILELCVAHAGPKLHSEIGRFRFLNEIVKLVSSKYLGECTPPAVKDRLIKLIYAWTKELKEPKIKEAYEMLKRQKVIMEDPLYVPMNNSPDSTKKTIFEDEEKTKLLKKLLQSKNDDDLSAANRLIKSMVREDEIRIEKQVERSARLETVNNNAKVLNDMLTGYSQNKSSQDDIDLMKELYLSCLDLRTHISKIASETECRADNITEVLTASDNINSVIERYEAVIIQKGKDPAAQTSSNLLDFDPCPEEGDKKMTNVVDELYDVFSTPVTDLSKSDFNGVHDSLCFLQPIQLPVSNTNVIELQGEIGDTCSSENSAPCGLSEIDCISQDLLKQSLHNIAPHDFSFAKSNKKLSMNAMKSLKPCSSLPCPKVGSDIPIASELACSDPLLGNEMMCQQIESYNMAEILDTCLPEDKQNSQFLVNLDPTIYGGDIGFENVCISLQDIQPSPKEPIPLFFANGIGAKLHFGQNKLGVADSVYVIILTSNSAEPISDYVLKVVVPKHMKVRLMEPSATELQSFNAFLPPPTISSILLIHNPNKENFSLQYVCTYIVREELQTHAGKINCSVG